jgi:hypothetical protein
MPSSGSNLHGLFILQLQSVMSEAEQLHYVLMIVCMYTGISEDVLKSETRVSEVVTARHLFCYVAKNHVSKFSEESIAKVINRDRSNVYNCVKKICDRIDTDIEFAKKVAKLVISFNGDVKVSPKSNGAFNQKQQSYADLVDHLKSENASLDRQLRAAQQLIKDQMLEIESYRKQNEILKAKQN